MQDFVEKIFPQGTEFIGFVDQNGVEYSAEEIKAIEWLEKENMRIEGNPAQEVVHLLDGLQKKMTMKALFDDGGVKFMLRSDDTLWKLSDGLPGEPETKAWIRIPNAALPPIPQVA